MSEPFFHVLFPGQARVCGRSLPPLTLWRLACLQAVRSPFLAASGDFTLADLLCALRTVRTPNLTAPDLRPRWRDLLTLTLHRRSARYREKHGATFIQWLALHQIRPELWQAEDTSSREITAPLILSQVVALMDCGLTHAEAWNTSPGYASWLITAKAERDNDRVKFATDDDDEINRMCDELALRDEAEVLAQAKADLPPAVFERWLAARTANREPLTAN